MPDNPKTFHHSRLHILTEDEIQDIFNLPNFTDEERLLYFALTDTELRVINQSRSSASKLNLIIQLGYFKSRRLFFTFELSDISDDIEFITRKYFANENSDIPHSPKIAVNTSLKHRRTVAKLHNYQFCGRRERKMIERFAGNAAKISGKPIYIFREILHFLDVHRIILPGYSFLQDIISKALNLEEQRLQTTLQNKLTDNETKQLEGLLSDAEGLYEITNLRREARDFTLSEIRREIERGVKIKELYQAAGEVLPALEISNQSIAYYASLVSYYRVDKLKRFDKWTTYLYLLCARSPTLWATPRYSHQLSALSDQAIYRPSQGFCCSKTFLHQFEQ